MGQLFDAAGQSLNLADLVVFTGAIGRDLRFGCIFRFTPQKATVIFCDFGEIDSVCKTGQIVHENWSENVFAFNLFKIDPANYDNKFAYALEVLKDLGQKKVDKKAKH